MIRDLVSCEFEAKPSNHSSGLVWLVVADIDEIEEGMDGGTEHAMTADAAEALAAELIEAAREARAYLTAQCAPKEIKEGMKP